MVACPAGTLSDWWPAQQEEVLSRDIRSVHQRQHAARSAVQGGERRQVPSPEVPQDTESNMQSRHNPGVCSGPGVLHDSEARPQAVRAPDTCGSRDVTRDSDAAPQAVHGPGACALRDGAEPAAPTEFQEDNEGQVSRNGVSGSKRTPQLALEERFDAKVDSPGDAGRESLSRSPRGYPQSRGHVHPNIRLEEKTPGLLYGDVSFTGKDVRQGSRVVCPDPERHDICDTIYMIQDNGHDQGSTADCQAPGLSVPDLLYRNVVQEQAVEQRAREPQGQYKVVLDGVQVGYDIDEQGCVLVCSARRMERGLLAA